MFQELELHRIRLKLFGDTGSRKVNPSRASWAERCRNSCILRSSLFSICHAHEPTLPMWQSKMKIARENQRYSRLHKIRCSPLRLSRFVARNSDRHWSEARRQPCNGGGADTTGTLHTRLAPNCRVTADQRRSFGRHATRANITKMIFGPVETVSWLSRTFCALTCVTNTPRSSEICLPLAAPAPAPRYPPNHH